MRENKQMAGLYELSSFCSISISISVTCVQLLCHSLSHIYLVKRWKWNEILICLLVPHFHQTRLEGSTICVSPLRWRVQTCLEINSRLPEWCITVASFTYAFISSKHALQEWVIVILFDPKPSINKARSSYYWDLYWYRY